MAMTKQQERWLAIAVVVLAVAVLFGRKLYGEVAIEAVAG